ncbi:regulatory protein GemA [Xanthobacter aminoxidans]|uniref:regulatory protein GemA n=1 Tax=Xanthobacter aminoxidans TaxID=186280 RepID=UPI0020230ACE|nr:regulatory protein GemA [Xanthobacter aminoxidans]MCL8381770.1 regulatory protein GemA [Xanthobacter aminoxidans]
MPLNSKQIGLLHVAKARLKLDEITYRAILYKCGGAMSARDLDQRGFDAAMIYFASLGFRSDWTKRTYGERPGMATPSQVELLRQLWQQWAENDNEAALNSWLERSYQISALRFADRKTAAKAINGLRAMIRRKLARVAENASGAR